MSAYPPPPPAGGPYPPQWDRDAARAQARANQQAAKAQRRAINDQRRAYRYQIRSLRRRSIVGPLILLAAGVIFLLEETGKLSWNLSFDWYARWWPAVLIVAGLVLLAEWGFDEHRLRETPQPGVLTPGPRSIGGGVVFLLIVLVLLGLSARGVETGLHWRDRHMDMSDGGLDHLFGNRSDSYDTITSAFATGNSLIVRNPHGDVTITGDSSDGQVHVSVHKQTYTWSSSDTRRKDRELEPAFTTEGGRLVLSVPQVDGAEAGLTLQMPAASALTVQADHGDVSIRDLHSAVNVSANHGDVSLQNITGKVDVHVNDDDGSITVHGIDGDLTIEGRNGDVDLADTNGAVTLRGDFFGDTQLQRVKGKLLFETSRTHFEAVQAGDFEVGSKDLSASDLVGPVVLRTRDKDITLERVQGPLQIVDRDGSIDVTQSLSLAPVDITNAHGSVDVKLAPGSGFELSARSENGDVEDEFGVHVDANGDAHAAHGTVGAGGVRVAVFTSDGDVSVRKGSGDLASPLALQTPATEQMTDRKRTSKAPAIRATLPGSTTF